MDIAKVDICFLLASIFLSRVYCISRWAPRATSALCRAPRGKDGRNSPSELTIPLELFLFLFLWNIWKLQSEVVELVPSWGPNFKHSSVANMYNTCRLGLPRSTCWKKQLVCSSPDVAHLCFWEEIMVLSECKWRRDRYIAHVPAYPHGVVNGPIRSLGVFSRQCPKWPIKGGSWQSVICRRGKGNLVWAGWKRTWDELQCC